MPINITMPRLSDTMESGTIIKWNVKEGDSVSAGDVIADVETDKATMEMQVYDDGTVAKIAVPEGQKANVGSVIAVLAGKDEDAKAAAKGEGDDGAKPAAAPAAAPAAKPAPQAKREADGNRRGETVSAKMMEDDTAQAKPARLASTPSAPIQREEASEDGRPPRAPALEEDAERRRISPVARHIADQHGIDLKSIEGSGPGGRIIKRDVLQAVDAAKETRAAIPPSAKGAKPQAWGESTSEIETAEPKRRAPLAQAPTPALYAPSLEAQIVPLSNMRQIIAKRLVESKTTIPHYQVTVTFNMDPLLELRSMLNAQLEPQGVKLSVNDFLVRCCALAMHEQPEFNASWAPEGDHIEIHGDVNIGIAISLPAERGGGLLVGTIRNADQKGLRQISYESKTLAEKARTRGLTIQEMSDSTFTISNLGMFGVDNFTAIINPPNSAILAVGAAIKKPVVRNDELTTGHEMNATLSLDHRVIDGATAAQYLQTLKQMIENPGTLLV